jgi:two-component system, chemotaxis family, protein-glutamate methylesterase/glutaminase
MARDIIVIGASAGGVPALKTFFRNFNPGEPVSVFVVLHISPRAISNLPQILAMQSSLPVSHAIDGEAIQPNRVYVAPPDHHLIVEFGHMHLTRGPRENRVRPAINPLFRSAALAYGPRVIGIVLTGMLDDGTAGLWEIKRRGGMAIVQSPDDAEYEQMPESAVANVHVDYQIPIDKMGAKILSLLSQDSTKFSANSEPFMSEPTQFTCPDCHGPISRLRHGNLTEYRCRVGHVYSDQSMLDAHEDAEERALWSAVESLEEGADLVAEQSCRQGTQDDATASITAKRNLAATIRNAIQSSPLHRSNLIHNVDRIASSET